MSPRIYELKTIIAVADGLHGGEYLARYEESVKQTAVADTIIVSKTDLADCARLDALAARLAAINPGARQLRVAHGDVRSSDILDHAGFDVAERSDTARSWLNDRSYAATVAPASANPAIVTFALTYDEEITLAGFRPLDEPCSPAFAARACCASKASSMSKAGLTRCRLYRPSSASRCLLEGWPEGDDRRSRLVFITRGIDAADIRRTFETFKFDAGRASRNMTINPATYARFRDTIELFRTSSRPAAVEHQKSELEI